MQRSLFSRFTQFLFSSLALVFIGQSAQAFQLLPFKVVSGAAFSLVDSNGVEIRNASLINLGEAIQNTESPKKAFKIKNVGKKPLAVAFQSLSDGFSYVVPPPRTIVIEPGKFFPFEIQFKTQTVGTKVGLSAYSTNDLANLLFLLAFKAVVKAPTQPTVPKATVFLGANQIQNNQSTAISFGSTLWGTASPTQTFTIKNEGTANLNIGAMTVPAGYQLVQSPASTILPGQQSNFIVSLSTQEVGVFNGNVSFSTNDSTSSNFSFPVRGEVTGSPILEANADGEIIGNDSTLAFGNITVGGTSPIKHISITNMGDAPLYFTSLNIAGPIVMTLTSDFQTLLPLQSLTFDLEIDTSTPGSKVGSVQMTTNDPLRSTFTILADGYVQTLPQIGMSINGSGVSEGATFAYGSITQNEAAVSKTFVISNQGETPLNVGAIQVPQGFEAGALSKNPIGAGESAFFDLRLISASVGSFGGEVKVLSNDPNNGEFIFNVSGQVTAPADLKVYSGENLLTSGVGTISFGEPVQGSAGPTQTFKIKNVGGSVLQLSSTSVSAGFSVVKQPAATLAVNAEETVIIRMDTFEAGAKTGQITIHSSDADEPSFVINASGNVITPAQIVVAQNGNGIANGEDEAISIGQVQEGLTGPTKVFSITNSGQAPLLVSSITAPAGFAMASTFSGTLTSGQNANFSIQLLSQTVGTAEGDVTIVSNDSDETSFTFKISGIVTANPCSPNDPTKGKALVFKDGPIDFATGAYRQPEEVCLSNLGIYDENGQMIGTNGGLLTGKYGMTHLVTLNEYDPSFFDVPNVSELKSDNNDFRVDYSGESTGLIRESVLWSSEVHMYYWVNDYRTRFLNDQFISELQLPAQIDKNLRHLQYRPDIDVGVPPTLQKPTLRTTEKVNPGDLGLSPSANVERLNSRPRGINHPVASLPPFSLAFDPEDTVGDYAGLAAFWVINGNRGWPTETGFGDNLAWQDDVRPAIGDGLSVWTSHRYTGRDELYKHSSFALRQWAFRACGGAGQIPCDKGQNVRNVMMFDQNNTTRDGVFPFRRFNDYIDGPTGSDLAALYVAAIFYDIEKEVGLGAHKTDLLFWKTISMVPDVATSQYRMSTFGANIQQAARILWPRGDGKSLYEEDLVDVLTSRGIAMNGATDFRTNLPAVLNSNLDAASANGFGSSHPESQPAINAYGSFSLFQNGYTHPDPTANYVAYQFYKHSKYGPCDKLALTDGTFTVNTTGPGWSYNNDGTFYTELSDRELGNKIVLLPNKRVRWMRSRQRCTSEAEGYHTEDVRPFGFRVLQATSNGFSFKSNMLSETSTHKTYNLQIVDPSVVNLGSASYEWHLKDYLGNEQVMSGSAINISLKKDEPFTVTVRRTRGEKIDSISFRERSTDLDRDGGVALVKNLISN